MNHYDLLQIIHDKTPSYISLFILLKFRFARKKIFHILAFFLRFVGILILCENFCLKLSEVKDKSLSYYLRYLTAQKLIQLTGITNKAYIIISSILLIMFLFRIIIYFLFLKRIKVKHRAQASIGVVLIYEALNIFEHLVYLLYPFILEFLAQIIFSFIFPDTFIIKMDQEKIVNIIFTIINAILIILYNIHNYFFMKIINNPYGDEDAEIKYRYSSYKFWIIFLIQNASIIQNIQLYFKTDEQVKIFSYIYSIFFFLLFIILFIMSVQSFNYHNGANTFISMMTIFCYVSIIIKFICSIFGYSFNTTGSIVALTIFKILVVLYFNHVIESFNEKYLLTTGINELFKINKDISNNKIYDCFIYIQEILKSIKNNNSNS